MVKSDESNMLSFDTQNALNTWLKENHASENVLLVKLYKKGSGTPSISWNELVIECLCWGWIDGVKKSLDEHSYVQRITPRQARSNWSKRNTEHVERLIKEGRMQEAGLAHVHAAKADGRWEAAYTVSDISVPEDFLAALAQNPKAKAFYQTLTKSNRYVIALALTSAKKPETRERRFTKYMSQLNQEVKPT